MLVAVVVAVVFNRDATGRGAEINLLCYFIFSMELHIIQECKATKVLARGAYADLPLLLSGTVRRDTWEGESLWPIGRC